MLINNSQNTPFLLVELLESFSNKEIIGLKQIISCDYFNKDKLIIKLLEVLVKKILHENKSNIKIQCVLFTQVFNVAFKDTTLTKKQKSLLSAKMSKLTKLVKRFLTIEELENSKINKSDLILNGLLKKKQFRLFEKQLKEEAKTLSNSVDDDHYDHLTLIEDIKSNYLFDSGKWRKNDNLIELMRNLDMRYLIKKLTLTTTALSFSKTKPSANYDLSILKLLESEYFIQYRNLKIPSVDIRVAVINLMLNKSNNSYNQLLQLLKTNEIKLPKNELRSFYTVAINFCIEQINNGQLDYYRNYVSVYKNLNEKDLVAVENIISAEELINIVTAGCRTTEFDWANRIIEKYVLHVKKLVRKNVENYCFGLIAFYKKDYEQSIEYLGKVENFSLYFDIIKRVILIKSYFELDKQYLSAVAQIFKSFESFIHNHKLIDKKNQIGYKKFIRVALNLYRLKHKVGIIKIETLKTIVEKATHINYKAWLLEKIEEIEKRK